MTNAEYQRYVRIEQAVRAWLKEYEKAEHDDPPSTKALYLALSPAVQDGGGD